MPGSTCTPPTGLQERRRCLGPTRLVSILKERNGGNMRLAIDKLDPPGVDALRKRGVIVVEGQALTEIARSIKSAEELELMRWTVRVCEAGMARIYDYSLPGRTEQEIWAELHYENIRSGGEWLETRLLTVGHRTNPWFQECSGLCGQDGEMLGFDTDMIGPYGYCADLSRSWTIGHTNMTAHQQRTSTPPPSTRSITIWRSPKSRSQLRGIQRQILADPGEIRRLPLLGGDPRRRAWPMNIHRSRFIRIGRPPIKGGFQDNMTVCVESLIGEEGKGECVKLETQVVITPNRRRAARHFPLRKRWGATVPHPHPTLPLKGEGFRPEFSHRHLAS